MYEAYAGVGDVLGDIDLVGCAGVKVDDAVELPSAGERTGDAGGGEALTLTEGKLVDDAGREDVGEVKAGDAAIALRMIGVLQAGALGPEVAGGSEVDGLGPSVGNEVCKAVVGAARKTGLQGMIVTVASAVVVEGGNNVGVLTERLDGCRVACAGNLGGVVDAAEVEAAAVRAGVGDRERGLIAELLVGTDVHWSV